MKRELALVAVFGWAALAILPAAASGGTVIHVSGATGDDANTGADWTAAKRTVAGGLGAAVSGDQVWVAGGTYVERITLKDGVGLYGGFAGGETELAQRNWTANRTILDGNQGGSVVVSPTGATGTTRIDGFTIRNGSGTVAGPFTYGGGIYCNSSSPTIANNTITENTMSASASAQGGGVYCKTSSPTIVNNVIAANTGGGGVACMTSSSPVIINNLIERNTSSGIGCSSSSSPTIANNIIKCNAGSGIVCNGSSPTIRNNRITGNGALLSGGGISCSNSSDAIIVGNVIAANSASSYGGGIYCNSSSPTIANNTITGNAAPDAGGIRCLSSSATIENTVIAFNSCGIYRSGTGGPTLRSNCVYGNAKYNFSGLADPTGTDGNISIEPRLAGGEYDGNWHIAPDSPCVDSGDDSATDAGGFDIDGQPRIQGNRVDIGADESDGSQPSAVPQVIVRVSSEGDDANDGADWTTPKRTVQAAIDEAAAVGGDVWVKAGTYRERIALRSFAHVFGGFAGTETEKDERDCRANVVTLDGEQGGTVVTAVSAGYHLSTVDGFTIRHGTGTVVAVDTCGGGIYCFSSSPKIANNTIEENEASDGGGICCSASSPTIIHNAIRNNLASSDGGGVCCFYSRPTIAYNAIQKNGACSSGGGIFGSYSSPQITNNTITGNTASLSDHSSYGGGGISCIYFSAPTIANNAIVGNIVLGERTGGGIYCSSSSPSVVNNMIVGNIASEAGGIWCQEEPAPIVTNTIIAFNSSGVKVRVGGEAPTLRYNCIYGNTRYNFSGLADPTGRDGNISIEPRLAGGEYDGNWHIAPDSACVDAGDDSAVRAEWLDIDGEPRIQGSGADIGADESDGTRPAAVPNVIVRVSTEGDDVNDGGDWTTAKRSVQAAIDAAVVDGGDVWVMAGTYLERITLRPFAHVYGGFGGTETARDQRNSRANATVLDGQQAGSVVTASLVGYRLSTIDGFTIRNGNAPGAGISCDYASPMIANNVITENRTCSYGGGIYCAVSAPLIVNNMIGQNTSLFGGGGIYCTVSCPSILNSTIAGNSGEAIYCFFSAPMIANTIVAFNSSGLYVLESGNPSVRHSCVYGNGAYNYSGLADPTGSDGNISVDPLFVRNPSDGGDGWGAGGNDDYGDLRLRAGSPCVDAGDNAAVPADGLDLDGDGNAGEPIPIDLAGHPRFVEDPGRADTGLGAPPIVDMGAYERIPGDCDDDADIDAADFMHFQGCFNGPNRPMRNDQCDDADLDADADVDLADFLTFQRCFNGLNRPPKCR